MPSLARSKDLPALVEETRPDLVVVAQMNRRGNFPAKALIDCRLRGIQVEDWPTFYEKETGKILVTDLRPSWLIFSDGFVKTPRTEIVKRLVDIGLSLVGLVLALPVMAVGGGGGEARVTGRRPSSASPGSGRTDGCSS